MGLAMEFTLSVLRKKMAMVVRSTLPQPANQLQRLSKTALPAALAALTILLSVRLTDTQQVTPL